MGTTEPLGPLERRDYYALFEEPKVERRLHEALYNPLQKAVIDAERAISEARQIITQAVEAIPIDGAHSGLVSQGELWLDNHGRSRS